MFVLRGSGEECISELRLRNCGTPLLFVLNDTYFGNSGRETEGHHCKDSPSRKFGAGFETVGQGFKFCLCGSRLVQLSSLPCCGCLDIGNLFVSLTSVCNPMNCGLYFLYDFFLKLISFLFPLVLNFAGSVYLS